MKNKFIAASLLAIVTTISFSAVNAEQKPKGPRGGKPPAEAFTACADLAEATSCSFTGDRGEVSGTCKAPRHGDGPLACAPERKKRGERPAK